MKSVILAAPRALLLPVVCAALFAPPSVAQVPAVSETRLANGLVVLQRTDRAVPLCAVRLAVRAGGRYDPANAEGTASLLSDTLLLGAAGKTEAQIDRELERRGADLSAGVNGEVLVVSGDVATVDSAALPALLELLADVVTAPSLPEGPVVRARERALAGLRGVADSHSALADRAFAAVVYGDGGHPYARPVGGTLTSLASVGPAELRAFHEAWVRPDRAILGIAGDCDAKVVGAALKKRFGTWKGTGSAPAEPALPPVAPAKGQVVLVDTEDPTLNQAQIRLGAPIRRTYSDPQYLAYHVSAEVLGGDFSARLNEELRVKAGLTYGAKWIYSFDDEVSRAGYVWTFAGLRDAARAVDLAYDTVAAYQKGTATDAELLRVKSRLVKAFPFRFETNAQVLAERIQLWIDHRPVEVLASYPGRVEGIDAAALDAVDGDFDLTAATLVVVANASARADLEALAQRRGLPFRQVSLADLGLR